MPLVVGVDFQPVRVAKWNYCKSARMEILHILRGLASFFFLLCAVCMVLERLKTSTYMFSHLANALMQSENKIM